MARNLSSSIKKRIALKNKIKNEETSKQKNREK
jgi:hypothetical protein